jgi:type IV pilus assembly protein PilC
MSRGSDDRPRKSSPRASLPPLDPDDPGDDGGSTFRPAPIPRPAAKAKLKVKAKPRPADENGASSRARKFHEADDKGGSGFLERFVLGSVGSGQLALFCRQLGQYLEAGVDLLKALGSLETQFANKALGPVIGRLRAGVKSGHSLSESMAREPQAFDQMAISMMRVAEAHGGIPELFRQLGGHYESRQRLFRQARSAMIYPVAVITVASGVIGLLSYFVLPKLVELLKDMTRGKGIELPLPTRILIAISDFTVAVGWWAVPVGLVVGGFLLYRFYKTSPGKALLDRVALMLPVFGPLLRKVDVTRFARTLSTLLEAGVDVGGSIDLTSEVQMTAPYRSAVASLGPAVMEGHELSEGLRQTKLFDADVIERVVAGEETGKLPETLSHLADDYEEQVEITVKNLGTLIQPLITIGMGSIVLFIAIAFVMAYVSILGTLGNGL